MAEKAQTFIEEATANQLKDKLAELKLNTAGAKAVLKSRLFKEVEKMSEAQLNEHFPVDLLTHADEPSGGACGTVHSEGGTVNTEQYNVNDVDNDEALTVELESLRDRLQKKQEITELRRKLAEISSADNAGENSRPFFTFRDVEESFVPFSGDDNYSVEKWIRTFEESAEMLGWDSRARFVHAKRLMAGTAKLFLRTVSFKSWFELKSALLEEFSTRVSSAEIHDQLRKRRKGKDETWQQYVFAMQELASLSTIDETDLVNYIVSGITDTSVNKMLLYGANNLADLKVALRKYGKIKATNDNRCETRTVQPFRTAGKTKCFNCNEPGHISSNCTKPKRDKGSCFRCGKMNHKAKDCTVSSRPPVMNVESSSCLGGEPVLPKQSPPQQRSHTYTSFSVTNNFEFNIRYSTGGSDGDNFSCYLTTLLDSGSAISFMQQQYLPPCLVQTIDLKKHQFHGINQSRLKIVGTTLLNVHFMNSYKSLNLFVVENASMVYPVILGRDFLKENNLNFNNNESNLVQSQGASDGLAQNHAQFSNQENSECEILNIDIPNDNDTALNINEALPYETKAKVYKIVSEASDHDPDHARDNANGKFEMGIKLTKDNPIYCAPRRLPYMHKLELQKILNDLLQRGIIRESMSPYASPIVLVQKKNKELRLCVDYREINKYTVRDNFPLPLIDDLLDRLRGKQYFSALDLRSGFHHVHMAPDSIKYTSFVTPLGQYEYLRMPFGLKNAPSVFQRYVNHIFKELVAKDQVLIYMDDILIATESIEDHLQILEQVADLILRNSLQLRLDKCKFLFEEIIYLGYIVNNKGIRPNPENLRAISEFPLPKCLKGVHSFLGLCSYFRRFIKNFATLARPLYDLLKKDSIFKFDSEELEAFEMLKSKLISSPILVIYSPLNETELHCDASGIGFGAILLQRQEGGKFHPVFYFSKRATEVESRYHSYELETLSIIYALRRFRVYLTGIPFKIITDCQSLTLTLSKKSINPRISRWVLELQNFDYKIEHRSGSRMGHVDALSRSVEVLTVQEGTFDFALVAAQGRDPDLVKLISELERGESRSFALINGLLYRKNKGDVQFYVPKQMEDRVIQTHHESLCHLGADKCFNYLKKSYWFPNMRQKIKDYVAGCLKCAYFSPVSGKVEGTLHNIPKGNVPFEVLHIDHYGPLATTKSRKKYIFLVVDGFSKFTKLYSVASTQTKEVIACLESYFNTYSRPSKIISDRGTCFMSNEFAQFLSGNNIIHHKVATHSPQSNGQVERINRLITPMLSKECGEDTTGSWYKSLVKVEFALNNTVNRCTGFSPSELLFGVRQKGELCDRVMEHIQDSGQCVGRDLNLIRDRASETIKKNQNYNKEYFDKRHKAPRTYTEGDYVMIKNVVTTPGINKKLLAKYRGPYEVKEVLKNDRYLIEDVEGIQLTRIPYKGISSPANMKPYIFGVES